MKSCLAHLLAITSLLIASHAEARTIAWGTELESILLDSNGVTLDARSFAQW
jgi:hypothetical protein